MPKIPLPASDAARLDEPARPGTGENAGTRRSNQALQDTRLVDRVPEGPVVMCRPQASLADSVTVRCRGPLRNCS